MNNNKMDLDITAETAKLMSKAPDWNFSDDCELLELMKRISQNLQDRANHTLQSLDKFDYSVKATEITLDNVNNSLRALHYGEQFVEYRVREEDEATENSDEETEVKPKEPEKSKEVVLKEFLENNMKMLRRYYDRRTIELPDSDDEEGAPSTTCIYQLRNPYNRPLPYLIGSKEWNDHWHVGLVESSNEYSDEEKSEEFSESSSSVDANEPDNEESFESTNVANLSDWASSSSLHNEKLNIASSTISNINSNQVDVNTVTMPITRSAPANDTSSSSSQNLTQPRPISDSKRTFEHDLFAALRDSPPSDDEPMISSSTSSSDALQKPPSIHQVISSQENLFDATNNERSASLPSNSSTQPATPKYSQVKRKPVNLFDDNEFNSFMSEIANKVQTRADSSAANTAPSITDNNQTPTPSKAPLIKPQAQQPVEAHKPDLFAEEPSSTEAFRENVVKKAEPPRRTVNLFDDSPPPSPKALTEKPNSLLTAGSLFEANPFADDDFLDDIVPAKEQKVSLIKESEKPKFTAKVPLFMDDSDDDNFDINNIFAKKPVQVTQTKKPTASASLFGDDDDSDTDLFGNKKPQQRREDKKPDQIKTVTKEAEEFPQTQVDEKSTNGNHPRRDSDLKPSSMPVDLFEAPAQQGTQVEENDKATKILKPLEEVLMKEDPPVSEASKAFNLLDATDSDEDDDALFKIPPSTKKPVSFNEDKLPTGTTTGEKNEEAPKEQKSSNEPKRVAPRRSEEVKLFKDLDSDEDDFFSTSKNVVETKENQEKIETDLFADEKEDDEVSEADKRVLVESMEPVISESINEEVLSEQIVGQAEANGNEKTVEEVQNEVIETKPSPVEEEDYDKKEAVVEMEDGEAANQESVDKTPEIKPISAAHTPSYNSIFMDEPPDDNEFFQTLGSAKLGASKLFDLENDFDEPALPEPPGSTMTTTDAGQPSGVSSYGGLQLFSEVPPDDDDAEDVGVDASLPDAVSRVERTTSGTTRLHTIFYDDFSETATSSNASAAAARPTQASTASLSFDNEPPPDEVDRSSSARHEEKPSEIVSVTSKRESVVINKLKKPTINIDVKALLPSTGAIPKVPKANKSPKQTAEVEEQTVVAVVPKTRPDTARAAPNSTSGESPNLLNSMNKTRVRAPAKRRPSTRRARQENYRKSLLDETHPEHNDDLDKQANVAKPAVKANNSQSNEANAKKLFLFADEDDDDDDGIDAFMPPSKSLPAASLITKPFDVAASQPTEFAQKPATVVSKAPSQKITKPIMKSFLDTDDDDDDDFFASKNSKMSKTAAVAAAPAPAVTAAPAKPKEVIAEKPSAKQAKSSIFGSDDDDGDDDNDDFLRALKRTPSKPKALSKTQTLFSDVDSDDGDDLFGGGGGGGGAKAKAPQHSKKPSNSIKSAKTVAPKATPSHTVQDNPLADLLGP